MPHFANLSRLLHIRSCQQGFTLAEVLIALLILGEIATFTIPKVLHAQQNTQNNAKAKEAISMVMGAFQQAQLSGEIDQNTKLSDLTPYMNYTRFDNSGTISIDQIYTQGTHSCTGARPCIWMHNGGAILFSDYAFGGTGATDATYFKFDPDGKVTDGTTNGPGKAVSIFVYYNGRMTDEGHLAVGTSDSNNAYTANPSVVPPWFQW